MMGRFDEPTHQRHRELHAALVRRLGVGGSLPFRDFAAFIMQATNTGTDMSVHRYANAMELLGFIHVDRRGRVRETVTVLAAD